MQEESASIYFVTGGGTGGHIYPAVAVANCLSENSIVYYVGNKRNMEFRIAKQNNYKFLHVNISGMPRKLNKNFIVWLKKLIKAIAYSIAYIKKYKPKAVFATGGYVSAPMVFACIFTKTPYMMHDCDAMPGLVTRVLSRRASCVSLAFQKAAKYIHNKNIIITGNPIRNDFFTITREEACKNLGLQNKLTLCVMGGSQGAKSINNATLKLLKEFTQEKNMQIVFQTGQKNYADVQNSLNEDFPEWADDKNLIVKPYYEDMVSVLKASDIVISRAGSLSLSEICASSCVPILIPYPYAAADHQKINAKCLLEKNACIYIEDKDLTSEFLREQLTALITNPSKIEELKQNASTMVLHNSTEIIVNYLKSL